MHSASIVSSGTNTCVVVANHNVVANMNKIQIVFFSLTVITTS